VTSLGIQVHGGMGYVEETGAAQFMRDVRIAAIYEGTNGIQAMDLVGRKLQGDGGVAARDFLAELAAFAAEVTGSDDEVIRHVALQLDAARTALEASTTWLLERTADAQGDVLAGAEPYLRQFGNVAGGYYLLRGVVSAGSLDDRERAYRQTILRFYADNMLSEATSLTAAVTAGDAALDKIDPEVFGA
jgi:alkylation response protein AidB-like acyl-CoA dehydrogenase